MPKSNWSVTEMVTPPSAGDHGQAFRELVVRPERLGELLADRVGRLDGRRARLCLPRVRLRPWRVPRPSGRLWQAAPAARRRPAPPRSAGLGFCRWRETGAGRLDAFRGLAAGGDLLRPEIRREGIAVGLAAMCAGRRTGGLNAAVAPGADVLQQAGLFGDLGKHRIRIGEKVLVRMRLVLVLVGDVLRGIFLVGFLSRSPGPPRSCQQCSRLRRDPPAPSSTSCGRSA